MPNKAEAASTMGITRNHSSRLPLRRGCGASSERSTSLFITSSSCFITSSRVLSSSVANNSKYSGHEEESGNGGEQQAADDRAAERGVLFSALAQPDSHRDHSDDHRERRHDYRPQSCGTSFQGCAQGIFRFGESLIREADDQDAV